MSGRGSGRGRHALHKPARFAAGEQKWEWAGRAWDRLRFPTRLDVTAAAAAVVAVAAMIAAVVAAHSGSPGSSPRVSAEVARANAAPAITGRGRSGVLNAGVGTVASAAAIPLVLTAVDHQDCPPAAAACVDLTRHITWLQADGRITFGPVQMEPGQPGSKHQTPRGTFRVEWKAGQSYQSNIYHEAMPWATFFAPGGIAFHGGSLTAWSHGCVHLTDANAHYYNEHLPTGAEVVVFLHPDPLVRGPQRELVGEVRAGRVA
jgi:hypothetical protein